MSYSSTLTVDAAFRRYEDIRHRLPTARFPKTTQECRGLLDLVDRFDAFVLDGFGVLNVGDTAIPGAVACIAALRSRGKRVVLLTNAASYTRATAVARCRLMGFDFGDGEVVSSRDICLRRLDTIPGVGRWGAIAGSDDRFMDISADCFHWSTDTDEAADGVILLSSAGMTDALEADLEAALRVRPRPVAVANPDLVAPRETGLSKEPGYYANRLADRLGIEPVFFGKPFGNAFDDALAQLADIDRDRIAMVGDTLHTDILGGCAAGMRTVLVSAHGLFAGCDYRDYVSACGIVPDFACREI